MRACVAMPTGQVLVWHLRIMMQPIVISGAVANLYARSPRSADMLPPKLFCLPASASLHRTYSKCNAGYIGYHPNLQSLAQSHRISEAEPMLMLCTTQHHEISIHNLGMRNKRDPMGCDGGAPVLLGAQQRRDRQVPPGAQLAVHLQPGF